MKKILIFGSKFVNEKIDLNYDVICRINFNLQLYDSSKNNIFFVNNHVYKNFIINSNVDKINKLYGKESRYQTDNEILNKIINIYNKLPEQKILHISKLNINTNYINNFLDEIKSPFFFKKQPRTGIFCIIYYIKQGIKQGYIPYILGFSLNNKITKTYYNNVKKNKGHARVKKEYALLNWLIDNDYIINVI